MASLRPSTNVGGGSVSSLIRSANSIQASVTANQDAIASSNFDIDHSDASFQEYASYLNGRISKLLSTGSIVDNTRAISMQNKLISAQRANVSFNIKNASIAVMAGQGSLTDKYNLLSSYYAQAAANGDVDLAQSLESQAYSTYQQIQYQKQTAADAAASLAKSSGSSTSTAEKGVANALIQGLQKFNNDFAHSGNKTAQKTLDDYVKSITPQLNALGVYLKPGMTLNAYSVAQGVAQAVNQAYTLAHDAVAPYDPAAADSIAQTAASFLGMDGQGGKIPTLAGNMAATTLEQAIVNPHMFSYSADPEFQGNKQSKGFANQNPQTGYKYDYTKDSNGNPVGVVPVFSQQAWVNVPMKINDVAQKLGLQIVASGDSTLGNNAIQVAAKKDSPDWVKKILGDGNQTTHLIEDQNGNINFEASSSSGKGLGKFLIQGNISGGKYNVYEWSGNGYTHITEVGGLGFNKGGPGNINVGNSPHIMPNGHPDILGGTFGNLNNFGGVNSLVANAGIKQEQLRQQQIAEANAAAARAMLAYTPPPLPNISTAPPAPTPNIAQPARTSVAMPTYPVAPKTVNPQQPTVNPQSPGGINLQGGGGFRLQ